MGATVNNNIQNSKTQNSQIEQNITVEDIFRTMSERLIIKNVEGIYARLGYILTGDEGGEFTVIIKNDNVTIEEKLLQPDVTAIMTAEDFISLNIGKLNGMAAFTSGKLKIEGDMGLISKSAKFFKKFEVPNKTSTIPEKKQELIMLRQIISIPQRFSTGPIMGKFLKALRDEKKILGNRCPKCKRIQTPPREICAVCRVRVDQMVEIGPKGIVANYDVAYYASPDPLTGESRETPYCTAFILLDGCSGNDVFWHEINPKQISKVKKGVRVKPVWAEKRTGAISDIKYFEIIDTEK